MVENGQYPSVISSTISGRFHLEGIDCSPLEEHLVRHPNFPFDQTFCLANDFSSLKPTQTLSVQGYQLRDLFKLKNNFPLTIQQ